MEECLDKNESRNGPNADQHESSQWVEAVNRGGLVMVHDSMYCLFVAMELELRKHLSTMNASTFDDSLKALLFKELAGNEDVLFHWETISINWESTEASELLHIMIQQFVTVRGFSFARGFMELYKQSKKKSTQKSKALRKTLVCHDD